MFLHSVLFALTVFQVPTDGGAIRGRVVTERSGETVAVPSVMVEVSGPAGRRIALTDAGGWYALESLTPGPLYLRAVHVGYEDVRVEVILPPGGAVELQLDLRPRPLSLPEVRVSVGLRASPLSPEAVGDGPRTRTSAELSLRVLEASPGLAEAGLGEAARRAGGNQPSDPTDVLFMRGSTADLKLVLLDGAPVYTPFHLGGLIRSFDASVLGSATHHIGGAPARYDGGLSYVLDLRTRSPARDRLRWGGGLDLMSASVALETPIGGSAAILASSRALHGLQSRLAGGRSSPYSYADGLVKGVLDLAPSRRLSLLLFSNQESVRLGFPADAPASAGTWTSPEEASWGNTALSLTWAEEWDRTALDVSASASRYEASLPVPPPTSSTAAPVSDPRAGLLVRGETSRLRLTADGVRFGAPGALRFGASADFVRMRSGAGDLRPQAGETSFTWESLGTVVGAYADALRPLSQELGLRAGLRLDYHDPGGVRAALRMALNWRLSEDALLTVAGGRYHQLIQPSAGGSGVELDAMAPILTADPVAALEAGTALSVASADHLVLTLEQQLTPNVQLTTEGFFKRFDGVGGVTTRDLNASGFDLRVLRFGERVTGWLGYSLSWFWESPDALGRADAFTGRHLLSIGMKGRIAGPWSADLAFSYSDGLPLTSVPYPTGRPSSDLAEAPDSPTTTRANAARAADAYLRVDVEIFADLSPRWGNRTVRVRPYLRVLNALNQRDGMFYYFEPWRDPQLRPLAELSFIPVLGLEWRF